VDPRCFHWFRVPAEREDDARGAVLGVDLGVRIYGRDARGPESILETPESSDAPAEFGAYAADFLEDVSWYRPGRDEDVVRQVLDFARWDVVWEAYERLEAVDIG
jgi:hypothetical protein